MRLTQHLRQKLRKQWWNNAWYRGREVKVNKDRFRYVESLEEKGIKVYEPQEIFRPHLPELSDEAKNFQQPEPVVKSPFPSEESHPNYHERPCYNFGNRSYFPQNYQLNHAKAFTKTVEVETGLPKRVQDALPQQDLLPNQDELIQTEIKETQMYDSTQEKLPKTWRIPYIGWHPVESTMTHRKMPYDVTKFSYGLGVPRTYGIPIARKNQNLMRGLFRYCDFLSSQHPSLLNRTYVENNVARQYFERSGKLTRIYLDMPFAMTDLKPLEAYAPADVVESTKGIQLPDLSPMNEFAAIWPKNVYRHENNFPISRNFSVAPNVHTVVELYNSHIPMWRDEGYHARALVMAFMTAMGQARLTYGEDVSGVLAKPVTVNFITTDGRKYHFSAFQLNTLDLNDNEGVKNIFWHSPELQELFAVCEYQKGIPALEGYNPDVFKHILAMYLQGAQ